MRWLLGTRIRICVAEGTVTKNHPSESSQSELIGSRRQYIEGSRAGEVFWNSRTRQVEFPFTLKGSLASPSVSVDWKQAVGERAGRALEDAFIGLIEENQKIHERR